MVKISKMPSSIADGLRCRCPRCHRGRLFSGFLKLAEHCTVCDLDFSFADPADGPAFFVMTAVSILIIGARAVWAVVARPPIALQFAVVMPGLLASCLGTLRPVKAWLVAEQFVHKAGEGNWVSVGTHGKAPTGYKAGKF